MNRFLWAVYFLCALLVLGSWFGLVPGGLAWIAWLVASAIALASWSGWLRPRQKVVPRQPEILLTAEERERARREMEGERDV
jgi:hypothetical protein